MTELAAVHDRQDILHDLGQARLTWLAQTTHTLKAMAMHDIDNLLDELNTQPILTPRTPAPAT